MLPRCPICRRQTESEGNPFRPFCSERCKLIDLDNWLEGRYRVLTSTKRDHAEGEGTEVVRAGTAEEEIE
jgi:uncharacterized protein